MARFLDNSVIIDHYATAAAALKKARALDDLNNCTVAIAITNDLPIWAVRQAQQETSCNKTT